jgi:hypothetical protein
MQTATAAKCATPKDAAKYETKTIEIPSSDA